jgi:hypothetical protein
MKKFIDFGGLRDGNILINKLRNQVLSIPFATHSQVLGG